MRFSQKAFIAVWASACAFPGVTSFTASGSLSSKVGGRNVVLWSTPEEERAALLSGYLAKSHEEKLKAVRAVEVQKDAEINSLKEQLKQRQAAPVAAPVASSTSTPAVGGDVEALSKEELVNAVKSYQQFMSKYIVDAQEQKFQAVKAAEAAVRQKYEAQLAAGGAPPSAPAPTAPQASAPPTSTNGNLYKQRNAHVVAAAAAGKSRWGTMEVEVAKTGTPPPIQATSLSAPKDAKLLVAKPPQAQAASGNVNLYAQRNAHLVAAAAAGKCRWGNLEVDRAVFLTNRAKAASSAPEPATEAPGQVPAEVLAADHGLRNDGGVGGLTLAERIASGSDAAAAAPVNGGASPRVPTEIVVNEFFQQRNVQVAAAARAGKARWGDMEVSRIQNSVPSVSQSINDDVAEADHGLKPDQGVSLADRVNLGAQLLGR